jgi:nitroreductase
MTQIDTLEDLLSRRFSCRAFTSKPVPRDRIERIIDVAKKAPSWCNAQPWQVVVTEGTATDDFREALMAEVRTGSPKLDLDGPESYPGIYGDRRRTVGWQLYDAVGVKKGDRAGSARQMLRNFMLFDAPHVAILTSPRALGPYGAMDSGGFVLAFTLAAQALGVDTIPQAAVANYAGFVREYFGIGDDRTMLCAISFGYADPDHPANSFRTERAALGDILEWKS